jgi:hypothetical protein
MRKSVELKPGWNDAEVFIRENNQRIEEAEAAAERERIAKHVPKPDLDLLMQMEKERMHEMTHSRGREKKHKDFSSQNPTPYQE